MIMSLQKKFYTISEVYVRYSVELKFMTVKIRKLFDPKKNKLCFVFTIFNTFHFYA